jgi:hypothetical protein
VGCGVRNDARYCDPAKPCSDPNFPNCDLVAHECVATPVGADLSTTLDLSVPLDAAPDLTVADLSSVDQAPDLTILDDLTFLADMRPECSTSTDCADPAKPICDTGTGTCRVCMTGDDAQCMLHGNLHCRTTGTNAGQCTQCNADTDCPSNTPICGVDGTCRKCRAHDECPASVCELRNVAGNGTCVAQGDIAYVDNASGTCPGIGTVPSPFCNLVDAVGTKTYVKVAPRAGHYHGLDFGGTDLTQYFVGGDWSAQPIIDANAMNNHAINANAASNKTIVLRFDGFKILGTSGAEAVFCDSGGGGASANLTLTTCWVDGGTNTVHVKACTATIGESIMVNASAEGVFFDNGSTWNLHNSFVELASNVGVRINTAGTNFHFNTVAFNGNVVNNPTSNLAGGVACNTAGITLDASIIARNSKASNGTTTQIGGGSTCGLNNVVTGPDTNTGGVQAPPSFVNNGPSSYDVHLKVDMPADVTLNRACCIDKVSAGGFTVDIEQDPRPTGPAADIGADEAL